MEEEKEVGKVTGSLVKIEVEDIPVSSDVTNALAINNQFLTNFLSTYNYKQRRELRVSSIRAVVFITNLKATPDIATAHFKFIVELEATAEMMVLKEIRWNCNKEDLDKSGFVSSIVSKIQSSYYSLMRHGLATVIRTAQKKGANVII